jgi:hypothetical protein
MTEQEAELLKAELKDTRQALVEIGIRTAANSAQIRALVSLRKNPPTSNLEEHYTKQVRQFEKDELGAMLQQYRTFATAYAQFLPLPSSQG